MPDLTERVAVAGLALPPTATQSLVPGQATASMKGAFTPRGIRRVSVHARPFQRAAEEPEMATHILADAQETLRGSSRGAATLRQVPRRSPSASA